MQLLRIAARCVQSDSAVRPFMGTIALEIRNDVMRGQQGYGWCYKASSSDDYKCESEEFQTLSRNSQD